MLLAIVLAAASAAAQDPFADAVHAYAPGTNGGFGDDALPGVLLGPPRGGGDLEGSFDVLALGIGGSIVLRFDLPVICDAPGPDFTVFENAFHSGSISGPLFIEFGYVAVSQDGETFIEMPYNATTGAGLAGQTPVFSHPDNDIDPLDPTVSGGDVFDLADVGLAWAAYVRITDVGGAIADFGDLPQFRIAPNAGLDLDAVAALHACDPSMLGTPTYTPTSAPASPTETAIATTPTATAPPQATDTSTPSDPQTATPTLTVTATVAAATPTAPMPLPGDVDGDGAISDADTVWLTGELYDGDGDAASAASGGGIPSGAGVDVNRDGRVTAADLAGVGLNRFAE